MSEGTQGLGQLISLCSNESQELHQGHCRTTLAEGRLEESVHLPLLHSFAVSLCSWG
jgi:hypothetical protein